MGCYDNTDSPLSLFPQPSSPRCPRCGNRVLTRHDRRRDGETVCTPLTCSAWRAEADHSGRSGGPDE